MHDHRPAQPPSRDAVPCVDLYSIVYVSTIARPVSTDDLSRLLEAARRRNIQEQVSGVLLHADGHFMQYLEGPVRGLSRVYECIKTDPLHYGLIDLVREPIHCREFADCPMAYHRVGAGPVPAPTATDESELARRFGTTGRSVTVAGDLLSKFWLSGRSAVAPALLSYRNARSQHRLWVDIDPGSPD